MRRQTAISACEIHFSVVIWIQSVTDANDILAPNLPLSLFNSVPSTWRPLLHCCVGVAMTTQSLCTHISARKRQRGAPWHYLYRHHQGHFLSAVCLPKADPSCPWATEQTRCARTLLDLNTRYPMVKFVCTFLATRSHFADMFSWNWLNNPSMQENLTPCLIYSALTSL